MGVTKLVSVMLMAVGMCMPLGMWEPPTVALAADTLNVDNLPNEPGQLKAQVEKIVAKVDGLVGKLKGNPAAQALVLDLMQTRDNLMRELPKVDSSPGDAKWKAKEMRHSVENMLRLLKDQYEKAAAAG